MIFDPLYMLMILPAMVLGIWAQFRIHSAYGRAAKQPAPLSGAAAARHVLDSAGLSIVWVTAMTPTRFVCGSRCVSKGGSVLLQICIGQIIWSR